MADNVDITAGSGTKIATRVLTVSGDANTSVQVTTPVYLTGSEGSWTMVEVDLGAGTVGSGTARMTLASNDPAVASLSVMDDWDDGSDRAKIVGAIAHDSPSAGNPVLLAGYAKAAAPTDVSTDGDAVNLWAIKNGALCVQATAAGALIGGDATNGLDVDVTRVKPDGTNTLPSGDAAARGIFVKHTDGTLTVGAVDETGSSAVDAAAVGGGTPHDSVNSGNPLYLGGEAIAHGTNPTQVAAADRTKWYFNRHGIPFVLGGHPKILTLKHTTITTAVTDAAIVSVSTGNKIVVTRLSFSLDNASTVFPTVLIGFGTANTPTTTQVLYSHGGYPAGGSNTIGDGSGILGIGADDEDLRITTTGNATGNGLQVTVSYFTIES